VRGSSSLGSETTGAKWEQICQVAHELTDHGLITEDVFEPAASQLAAKSWWQIRHQLATEIERLTGRGMLYGIPPTDPTSL
jgi:hypothetical protein